MEREKNGDVNRRNNLEELDDSSRTVGVEFFHDTHTLGSNAVASLRPKDLHAKEK